MLRRQHDLGRRRQTIGTPRAAVPAAALALIAAVLWALAILLPPCAGQGIVLRDPCCTRLRHGSFLPVLYLAQGCCGLLALLQNKAFVVSGSRLYLGPCLCLPGGMIPGSRLTSPEAVAQARASLECIALNGSWVYDPTPRPLAWEPQGLAHCDLMWLRSGNNTIAGHVANLAQDPAEWTVRETLKHRYSNYLLLLRVSRQSQLPRYHRSHSSSSGRHQVRPSLIMFRAFDVLIVCLIDWADGRWLQSASLPGGSSTRPHSAMRSPRWGAP